MNFALSIVSFSLFVLCIKLSEIKSKTLTKDFVTNYLEVTWTDSVFEHKLYGISMMGSMTISFILAIYLIIAEHWWCMFITFGIDIILGAFIAILKTMLNMSDDFMLDSQRRKFRICGMICFALGVVSLVLAFFV